MAAPDSSLTPAAPLVAPPAARRLRWLGDRGLAGLFVSPALALQTLLGFTIAYLISRRARGRGLMTTLFLTPMMLSPVVVGLFWKFMLDTQFGVVNSLLGSLGGGQGEGLTNQRKALGSG